MADSQLLFPLKWAHEFSTHDYSSGYKAVEVIHYCATENVTPYLELNDEKDLSIAVRKNKEDLNKNAYFGCHC